MGFCNNYYSTCFCTFLSVHFSFAIIFMGKRELIALLNLSSWCLVIVVWLFRTVPRVCLQFVIVLFPDHTLLYLTIFNFIIGLHLGRFLVYIEMLYDARVASLGFFKDNVCTTIIKKEKKCKIKFQVFLKFAQILLDYIIMSFDK